MRKAALILGLLMAGSLIPAEAIAGSEGTAVTHYCVRAKVKPRKILFACADGGSGLRGLRWESWNKYSAKGRGKYYYNDCDPYCADGTLHKVRTKVRLRGREWCPNIERYVFKRAKLRFSQSVQGRRRSLIRLSCPF